ncbi:MAG: sugar transferase [Bacteroidaceae bacterium]|nr:sugar transferase [Bacteroidaceae bacterium]
MINQLTCSIEIMELSNIDGMNSVERVLKRTFDVIGAVILLVVLSPVFLCIYVVQKLTSKGPAIYTQERVGKGGRPFMIYKFRTMIVDAEKDGHPVLEQTDDPRLTPFGKMLRKRHLDELPQIWNVLRGDMSFVGYRPERQYFIDQIMSRNPDYVLLFQTQPGVTSIATIKNGYTDTMEKMLKRLDMDLDYLRNRSLLLDAKIVIMTVFNV